ncbi:MAG: lipopolysaccharide transport system ATP-binding protein [Flavobacteriales bacterium]|jgi:lipopolysaccharide transport system ATP-binding protein
MKDIAIQIKGVSKQYRLGTVGTGTLSHDLNRWWHKIRGKEDPYLKIGEVNNRASKGSSDYVWALRDINFEVEKGEVLGIIGKNGAGKSTLLKILSQVTGPTQGTIKAKGRIASLLEVGTGFHPELTGRENVFLNGTILGMTNKEVQAKLDEIVEFSGVERYIDTPVKRYSSGMKVRLAFAVAAHLDPEILVVDEVLAVGDAEFQKKAIGKMQELSQSGGRTVLFVSHNMATIKALCTRAIVLKDGTINFQSDANNAVNYYLKDLVIVAPKFSNDQLKKTDAQIRAVEVRPLIGDLLEMSSGVHIMCELYNPLEKASLDVTIELKNSNEVVVMHVGEVIFTKSTCKVGTYQVGFEIPPFLLNQGNYVLDIIVGRDQRELVWKMNQIVGFEIAPSSIGDSSAPKPGVIRPQLKSSIIKVSND